MPKKILHGTAIQPRLNENIQSVVETEAVTTIYSGEVVRPCPLWPHNENKLFFPLGKLHYRHAEATVFLILLTKDLKGIGRENKHVCASKVTSLLR